MQYCTRLLSTIKGHIGNVRAVAFSPDRHTLAIANESTVRLWEVSDPHRSLSKLGILPGNTGGVYSVAFSPDGNTLATASADKTALLWETNDDSVAARICRITPHITKGEWALYLPGLSYRPPCLQDAPLADR